ncbi:MAG: hypothetical protein KJ956_03875 [Actinobacteria bacterium]|nr:hypothetical protein [Actinomycetota bacterium]
MRRLRWFSLLVAGLLVLGAVPALGEDPASTKGSESSSASVEPFSLEPGEVDPGVPVPVGDLSVEVSEVDPPSSQRTPKAPDVRPDPDAGKTGLVSGRETVGLSRFGEPVEAREIPVTVGVDGGRFGVPVDVSVEVLDAVEAVGVSSIGLAARVDAVRGADDGLGVSYETSSVGVWLSLDYSQIPTGGLFVEERLKAYLWTDCLQSIGGGPVVCATREPLDAVNDLATKTLTVHLRDSLATSSVPEVMPLVSLPWGFGASGLAVYRWSGGGGVVSADSGSDGPSGDFGSSPLAMIADYQVSLQTGSFSTSYPFPLVPAAGGGTPSVGLSYDSGSIDGMNPNRNTQGGEVGLGWSLGAGGSITREFVECTDVQAVGDLCPMGDAYSLNLNGVGSALVRADGSAFHNQSPHNNSGEFRLADDPYWRVELKTSTYNINADVDNEWWEVTTPDGTKYRFGRDQYGQDSVWWVPIYSPSGTAYAWCDTVPSGYLGGTCPKAWQWNLDEIEDPNGNITRFYYDTEMNYFSARTGPVYYNSLEYVRAGYLEHIEYTIHDDHDDPNARVVFTYGDRCDPDASNCGAHTQSDWPDTPWDLKCTGSVACEEDPTFWMTQKLEAVESQAWDPDAGTNGEWVPVDRWELSQDWDTPPLDDEDDESLPRMFLDWIKRVDATEASSDYLLTSYDFVWLENRTHFENMTGTDGISPMRMPRVDEITNPLGGVIDVTYGMSHDCEEATATTADDYDGNDPYTNIRDECDQYWTQWYDEPLGTPDMFNKWKVKKVTRSETDGGPAVETDYEYVDPPDWHHQVLKGWTCGGFWSDYRGHQTVREIDAGSGRYTEHRFFQGMDEDHGCNDTPLDRDIALSDSTTPEDLPQYRGKVAEVTVYDGDPDGSGVMLSRTITTYDGPVETVDDKAWFVAPDNITTTQFGDTEDDLTTKVSYTYDAHGNVTQEMHHGEVGVAWDERNIHTQYVKNTSAWILNTPKRVRVRQGLTTTGTVLGGSDYYYDGHTGLSTAPDAGNPTEVRVYSEVSPDVEYVVTITDYDSMGRPSIVWDPREDVANRDSDWDDDGQWDARTLFGFDSNSGATIRVRHKGPDTLTSDNYYEYDWRGAVTRIIGPNTDDPGSPVPTTDEVTDAVYDWAGRLIEVWNPGRDRTMNTASTTYIYTIHDTAPSRIRTKTVMNGGAGTVSGFEYFDGFGRPIQTQVGYPATTATSSVTSVTYDDSGQVQRQTAPYQVTVAAGTSFREITWSAVNQYTQTGYDVLGRVTRQATHRGGNQIDELWETLSVYDVGKTIVTDPNGNDTTTYTDSYGRVIKVTQEYYDGQSTRSIDTEYHYDRRDQLIRVEPPGITGDIEITYDLMGRKTTLDDPDTGLWTYSYDTRGNLTAQGQDCTDNGGTITCQTTLTTTYDAHNRPRTLSEGSTELAEWTYDNTGIDNGLGRLYRSTVDDSTDTARITVGGYDLMGRVTSRTWRINGVNYPVAWTYYTGGQLASITYPDGTNNGVGETVTYGYDDTGRPQTLTGDGTYSNDDYVTDATYTPQGTPSVRYLNDADTGSDYLLRQWIWDPDTLRLDELWAGSPLAGTAPQVNIQRLEYENHDQIGNITRIRDYRNQSQRQCYEYDDINRLTRGYTGNDTCTAVNNNRGDGIYDQTFTYADSGNITQLGSITDYTYGAGSAGPHAVTTADGITYTYDNLGNMKKAIAATTTTYTYNDRNQLTNIGFTGGTGLDMVYDADGNRVQRTHRYAMEEPTDVTTTYYIGDIYEIIYADAPGGGTTSTRTNYTFGGDHIAVRADGPTDTLTYLFGDHLGSVAVTYDPDHQTLNRQNYHPYGAPRGTPGTLPSDHTYTGQIDDPGALMYYGARYYQPGIGRFTQPDSIIPGPGDGQSYNRYMYVRGNPVMANDPTGHTFNFQGVQGGESRLPRYRPEPGEVLEVPRDEWQQAVSDEDEDMKQLIPEDAMYWEDVNAVYIFLHGDEDLVYELAGVDPYPWDTTPSSFNIPRWIGDHWDEVAVVVAAGVCTAATAGGGAPACTYAALTLFTAREVDIALASDSWGEFLGNTAYNGLTTLVLVMAPASIGPSVAQGMDSFAPAYVLSGMVNVINVIFTFLGPRMVGDDYRH